MQSKQRVMSLSEWIKDGCKNMNSFLDQQNIEQSYLRINPKGTRYVRKRDRKMQMLP